MDANYIVSRLKSTPYKYPTVALIRARLRNLDENTRREVVANLKMELWRHSNVDIHEPLFELVYKMPMAS